MHDLERAKAEAESAHGKEGSHQEGVRQNFGRGQHGFEEGAGYLYGAHGRIEEVNNTFFAKIGCHLSVFFHIVVFSFFLEKG